MCAAAHKAIQLGLPLVGIDADVEAREQFYKDMGAFAKDPVAVADFWLSSAELLDGDTASSVKAWRADVERLVPDGGECMNMLTFVDIITLDCIGPEQILRQMRAGPSVKNRSAMAANERRDEVMCRHIVDLVRGTYTGRACTRVLAVLGRRHVHTVARVLRAISQ